MTLDASILDPFINATVECFETMLDMSPKPVDTSHQIPPIESKDICAIIGLSGEAQGFCALNASEAVTLEMVSNFVGEEVTTFDEDTMDAIGEIINIIAGGAKAGIKSPALSISLPSIMHGKKFVVSVPLDVAVATIVFQCESGASFSMIVGMKLEKK